MVPPTLHITCRRSFAAAHRLHTPLLSDEENRTTFGPCLELHGHNYVLLVTVKGHPDPHHGMVMNFKDLVGIMEEEVLDKVDHRHLNEVDFLAGIVTTAENLVVVFWDKLQRRIVDFPGCSLHSIRLYETEDCYAEYFGEGQ